MGNGKSVLKGISGFVTYIKKRKGVCFGEGNHYRNIWDKKVVADLLYNSMGEESEFRIYPDYRKIYRGKTEIVLSKAEYELFILYLEDQG